MSAFKELIEGDTPVLVLFVAEWGKYCDEVTDVLKQFKSLKGDDLKMIRVDIDKNASVAGKFDIVGVPTTLLFKKGALKWRYSGKIEENRLEEQFNKL
jgi:thioredoxin 1